MKAYREEEPELFVPVHLVLVSQKEVDAVYAVCNCVRINITIPQLRSACRLLEEHRGPEGTKLTQAVINMLREED